MKKLLVIPIMALITLGLKSCSLAYSFKYSEDNLWTFGVSDTDAFMISYNYLGGEENKTIIIPDKFNNVPVNRLGGYTGRGYPCPFHISLSDQEYSSGVALLDQEFFENKEEVDAWYPNGYEIIEVVFKIYLGKNIKELYYHIENEYYQIEAENEKTKLYTPIYYFECSEDNKTFYAENGVLYKKSNNELAEWKYSR